jgi:Mg-chelatase subunit ChlD
MDACLANANAIGGKILEHIHFRLHGHTHCTVGMDTATVGNREPVFLNVSVASEKRAYGFKPSETVDVDFIVGCNATQQKDVQQQIPVRRQDIVLVLDVSGSMDGSLGNVHSALGGCSRIDLVRNSCEWLLQNLPRATTSVGVISFHSNATIVHPLRPLDTHLDSLLGSVAALRSQGGTNMWEGMQMGSKVLLNKDEDSSQSQSSKIMIVLSDGDVNEGRRDIAAAVAETSDYTQMELWMFAVSSAANTSLCEAAVRSCGGTLIAISDPEAVPAAFGSFCGAERLAEQLSLTLTPKDGAEFSVTSLSVQNRSTNTSQVKVALGFLMTDTPRYVLFRARVRMPDAMPAGGVVHLGSLASWCLAAAGDISMEVPLSIQLSPSAEDGDTNMQVAKAVQKEEMARAMRSGNVQHMRSLADKLQKSAAAAEFAADIAILLQLAQDFEARREDARMNSIQCAQELSNNRSMQSATRLVESKASKCSPMVVHRSKAASDEVTEKMSKAGGSAMLNVSLGFPAAVTPATIRSAQQPDVSGAPEKDAADLAPGVVASIMSGLRSVFGGSSAGPDMQ